ncbi:hypothetical protein PANT_26c00053 [Moesziomyces antarcticus T-34]|uniref:Uncharacterized protein n=1 Tax=Pseudozyma antarctica (strain T-34) TaxID=1151754 RepID=M9M830_PSEA3|nr:hypothetical protein PANT_26c00053 [Moesziomyces antarcticus T-34]
MTRRRANFQCVLRCLDPQRACRTGLDAAFSQLVGVLLAANEPTRTAGCNACRSNIHLFFSEVGGAVGAPLLQGRGFEGPTPSRIAGTGLNHLAEQKLQGELVDLFGIHRTKKKRPQAGSNRRPQHLSSSSPAPAADPSGVAASLRRKSTTVW